MFTHFTKQVEGGIDNETKEQDTDEPDIEFSYVVDRSRAFFGSLDVDSAAGKIFRGPGMALSTGCGQIILIDG